MEHQFDIGPSDDPADVPSSRLIWLTLLVLLPLAGCSGSASITRAETIVAWGACIVPAVPTRTGDFGYFCARIAPEQIVDGAGDGSVASPILVLVV